MNTKTLAGAGLAAVIGLGVLLLGAGERSVGVSQSAAQTPGTCEALETRTLRHQCIALAECFGTDYKNTWYTEGAKTCTGGASVCTAINPGTGVRITVNCEDGTIQ